MAAAADTIMVTMMATPSFALFAVLQDALISTRILCAPTNMTATAQSPVLTCFPFNVAFVAEMVTLQVTASSSRRPSRPLLPLLMFVLIRVCPPFHQTFHQTPFHQNNIIAHPPELCLKQNQKSTKKNSKLHFLLSTAAADV